MSIMLYLLGFTYPVVRQTAAQALYTRMLEERCQRSCAKRRAAVSTCLTYFRCCCKASLVEQGDFDLRGEEGVGAVVPQERTNHCFFGPLPLSLPMSGWSRLRTLAISEDTLERSLALLVCTPWSSHNEPLLVEKSSVAVLKDEM
eukprot:981592-Amphidinium_carterae.1